MKDITEKHSYQNLHSECSYMNNMSFSEIEITMTDDKCISAATIYQYIAI